MALWDIDPAPGAGCPLLAGWRVVVDWCAPWQTRPRSYGDLTYGDLTYGAETTQPARWYDITAAVNLTNLVRGCVSGENWQTPVEQCTLEVVDDNGTVVQIPDTDPGDVDLLAVGCRLRAGVLDPGGVYHPLFTGRVERITDVHDEPPRVLAVEAFGQSMDLAYTVPVTRPAETARTRLNAALAANAYWDWAPFDYTRVTGDPSLLAVAGADWSIRQLLDVTAVSAAWSIDTTGRGAPRVQPWPLPVGNPVAFFTDCDGVPPGSTPAAQTYVSDMAELVNTATAVNTAGTTATATDTDSAYRFGVRTDGLGLPLPVLHTSTAPALNAIVTAVVARYAGGIDRCTGIVYTADDLSTADDVAVHLLERGATVTVDRYEAAPASMRAVVAGVSHRIARESWTTTLALTDTTVTGIPVAGTGLWDAPAPGWDIATWWL